MSKRSSRLREHERAFERRNRELEAAKKKKAKQEAKRNSASDTRLLVKTLADNVCLKGFMRSTSSAVP